MKKMVLAAIALWSMVLAYGTEVYKQTKVSNITSYGFEISKLIECKDENKSNTIGFIGDIIPVTDSSGETRRLIDGTEYSFRLCREEEEVKVIVFKTKYTLDILGMKEYQKEVGGKK